MEKHKCKLCSRVFANGRALGGHMKAHLAPLPIPPKPQHHHHFTAAAAADSSSTTSSSSMFFHNEEDDVSKAHLTNYTLRENPKKSRKLPDPDDGESETESKNPTRRRSKRKERRIAGDPEPLSSSVSDTTSDEDAAAIAMCLVMLSRDTWPNQEPKPRHRCEICNKSFRSSQALGGHRVTHRKLDRPEKYRKKTVSAAENDAGNEGDGKVFECPYCYRVFSSGQALGGHKRSHVMGPAAAVAASTPKTSVNLIDLNLPAPEEEDDGSVVSDVEIADQLNKSEH